MRHPLEFVAQIHRRRFFLTFLFLTLILFAVFRILDQPLRTPAAPNGIVSFELAGSVERARAITDEWKKSSLLLSATAGQPNPDIVNVPYAFAAFSLGIDYLFMPFYSFALAFGTLLAASKHTGWLKSLGAVAGYGAFAAALFDAVENYALFQILLNRIHSPYPEIAFYCASIKFGLLALGLVYGLAGWLIPSK
ncbi:MAG: hypothetical protein C3F07_19975 [Anaerolineales bacterium]|nr:MAG: hypothetical protein C3F07_19975 [Anaerolineales bacterium]